MDSLLYKRLTSVIVYERDVLNHGLHVLFCPRVV